MLIYFSLETDICKVPNLLFSAFHGNLSNEIIYGSSKKRRLPSERGHKFALGSGRWWSGLAVRHKKEGWYPSRCLELPGKVSANYSTSLKYLHPGHPSVSLPAISFQLIASVCMEGRGKTHPYFVKTTVESVQTACLTIAKIVSKRMTRIFKYGVDVVLVPFC